MLPKIPVEVINRPNFTTPVQSISNPSRVVINRRMMQQISKDIPLYPDPVARPPSEPVEIPVSKLPENVNNNPELKTDFEEGVIFETHQRPDKLFFQEPQEFS